MIYVHKRKNIFNLLINWRWRKKISLLRALLRRFYFLFFCLLLYGSYPIELHVNDIVNTHSRLDFINSEQIMQASNKWQLRINCSLEFVSACHFTTRSHVESFQCSVKCSM